MLYLGGSGDPTAKTPPKDLRSLSSWHLLLSSFMTLLIY